LGVLIGLVASATAQADPMSIFPGLDSSASLGAPESLGASSGAVADAFINLGTGPYAAASLLTTGNPQAWYSSPGVANLFGGTPTPQQQQSFDQAVMQDVQTTFQLSGISVSLTDNPAVAAPHSLSLVSGAASAPFPGAIGTTDLGANGFSFVDPIAQAAQSVNQLDWIVAHNISHELMLAFGVGENYDQTGNYIDARNANLAMMINPNATFSAAAAQAIMEKLAPGGFFPVLQPGAQVLEPAAATPEPSTVIVWGALTVGAVAAGRSRRRTR
jgi:hypothetical protein